VFSNLQVASGIAENQSQHSHQHIGSLGAIVLFFETLGLGMPGPSRNGKNK
jgi:hypothetical protein